MIMKAAMPTASPIWLRNSRKPKLAEIKKGRNQLRPFFIRLLVFSAQSR